MTVSGASNCVCVVEKEKEKEKVRQGGGLRQGCAFLFYRILYSVPFLLEGEKEVLEKNRLKMEVA